MVWTSEEPEEDYSMVKIAGADPLPEEEEEEEKEEEEEELGRVAERENSAVASRLLDTVLSSLYDFGESLPDGKKKSKKKHLKDKLAVSARNTLSEDKGVDSESESVIPAKRKNFSNFFDSLKDELTYDCMNQKKSVIKTCPSDVSSPKLVQQGNTTEVEVVTFCGHHRKKKVKLEMAEDGGSTAKHTDQKKHVNGQQFNLEKSRLEVHQLGITGFGKKEQRILEQERAIMLGAKPPKKEYLNYKILQEKIKEKKAVKKEENVMEKKSESFKRRKKKGHEERKSKKKTKQRVLPTGQVGTFKNGTLILRSSDIKKIKSSKVVK
ncbi:uncharacterized protein C1orf131 homolog [Varanus komodoensis]|uniref:Chromosome 1 open reading frame 131 n=1 Tax=Varanus komodoensis TaxID=61221 RepID=A0A8D2LTB2_VARKO|nr:uncharacterized protein C1orf131 homolog [Varanus komodoensis]